MGHAQHKGDVTCDICKHPIANLPPVPEEVLAAREAARRRRTPAFNTASEPNFADYLFDAIRATWVTMIVCVLFFDLTVGQAFLAGAMAGVLFALVSAMFAACARQARTRSAARAVEAATAQSRQEHLQRQGGGQGAGAGAGPSTSGGGRGSSSGSGLMQPLLANIV